MERLKSEITPACMGLFSVNARTALFSVYMGLAVVCKLTPNFSTKATVVLPHTNTLLWTPMVSEVSLFQGFYRMQDSSWYRNSV